MPATAKAQMSRPAKRVTGPKKGANVVVLIVFCSMGHAGECCAISLLLIVPGTAYDVRRCRPRLRTPKMRLITFIVAVIAASVPASAQGWREYEYPNEGFTVAFP